MELHTLGVDGGYTQKDVDRSRARVHRLDDCATRGRAAASLRSAACTTTGEKVVLGHTIKAGGGEKRRRAGARHPRGASGDRAVHRDEAGAAVRRRRSAAGARRSRGGSDSCDTGGDIREVVRTIVTSPEFFAPDAYRAKVKTPFEFVVERAACDRRRRATTRSRWSARLQQLGMPLYTASRRPVTRTRADAWVNTGALRQPHELRACAARGTSRCHRPCDGRRPSATSRPAHAMRIALVQTCCTAMSPTRHGDHGRRRRRHPSCTDRLALGSPEFQRR